MHAGGILENTNQSINFLRNPSRDASIGIDGVYSNPAGVMFLDKGWHVQFNWMAVRQQRNTLSGYEFPNYGQILPHNASNPTTEDTDYRRLYKGDVRVPIQPSLYLVHNSDTWSIQLGFGFIGGGGGCEFKNGLGSLESLAALSGISTLAQNGMAMKGYSLDTYMKGTSYDMGLTLGVAHRFSDRLSGYVGARAIILMNSYKGHLKDISFTATNGFSAQGSDFLLDCDQRAFGIAPIVGVDFMPNEHWNIAAKYEFRTPLTATTTAHNNEAFDQLAGSSPSFAGYIDDAETRQDLPGYMSIGVQYSPTPSVRVSGGYHRYFDTATRQYDSKTVDDTNEMTLGVEYDINRAVEVSCGMQKTWYHVDDSFQSDASFILNSYSIGGGVGINVSKKVRLNIAYFQTMYSSKDITSTDARGMTGSIEYRRTNKVLGVGVDLRW